MDGFKKEKLPSFLLYVGWNYDGVMIFSKDGFKILFDSSNVFQIQEEGKFLGSFYCESEEELAQILKEKINH